jgi:TatD DNase family protein
MNFVDSHAHLTSEQILPFLQEVLERAKDKGISKIINICTDENSLKKGLLLHEDCPWVYNAAATTPHDVELQGASFFPLVERTAMQGKLIAIGETGLDYFYEHSNRKQQQKYLSLYFSLATQTNLPLIFHCREAFTDLFSMADQEYREFPAVLHCFTGTIEEAKGVLDRGWYLSFSGILTFKKSSALREVAKYVPLNRLLIETDSPYLAPQNHRGKLNEPSYLPEIAQVLAATKGISVEQLASIIEINTENFFLGVNMSKKDSSS